jgi:hypothetical protein
VTSTSTTAERGALRTEARLFSSYAVNPLNTLWTITEADRSSTWVLLSKEY